MSPWNHSKQARMIVNSLCIGQIVNQCETFNVTVTERHKVNDYTDTFMLRTEKPVEGVKQFYRDLTMLGRHYKIVNDDLKEVVRYYTICNCLIPHIYQEYLRVIYEIVDNDTVCHFDNTLFLENDTNEVALTIKNYKKQGGLSHFMFNEKNEKQNYWMSGPMGKGLQIEKEGIHIAFTAGTGCLLFLDLVAHLVRKNLKKLNEIEDSFIGMEDFKFVFFVSFPKREDVIGIELCEGLQRVCKKYEIDNFEFIPRISNEIKDKASSRWDFKFIDETLSRYRKQNVIKKVWVCGPPIMNEMFDKSLEELGPKYGINRHGIDVM